jgi:hypothetical protein
MLVTYGLPNPNVTFNGTILCTIVCNNEMNLFVWNNTYTAVSQRLVFEDDLISIPLSLDVSGPLIDYDYIPKNFNNNI